MRVGILAGCLGRKDGGPETYERELIRAIGTKDRVNHYTVYSFERAARDCLGPLPPNVTLRVLWPGNRWLALGVSLPLILLRDRIDVLHATLYPPPFCPVPFVFTMHDISPIARPEFFTPGIYRRLNPLVRHGLRNARNVICVSRDAMETTAAQAGVGRDRLAVVPHGVGEAFRPMSPAAAASVLRAALGIEPGYLLYVGKIMARKNMTRLIEAYARFIDATGSELPLVLAGKRLYDNAEMDAAISRHGLQDRVREMGHVPDAALPALYAGATMLVYATLWEGFGLPVLEAMASGTPVIASNLSSVPEVAGDAAILVDPMDVGAIAEAMGRIHGDAALRARMRVDGLVRAAEFTWQRTALETIRTYASAVGGRSPAPDRGEPARAGQST